MKCYVDADGVLCDFVKAVLNISPVAGMGLSDDSNPLFKKNMYKRIDEAGESFWADMDWAPGGRQLWDYLKPYHPIILTNPGEFKFAKAGRISWIDKNMPGTPCFFEEEKWRYVEDKSSILIDDFLTNTDPWIAKGGSAILYKSFEQTKKEFEALMNKPAIRISLASHLRDIVAMLSVQNLKEYLNKAQGVLAPSSPLKSIIVKEILNKDNLKDEDIKSTYQKLKAIVKGYNQSYREPFQITILQPLRAYFDKNISFNPHKLLSEIKTQKDIMRKPEQELSETKKTIRDVSEIPFPKVLSRLHP